MGRYTTEKDLGWAKIMRSILEESKRGEQSFSVGFDDEHQAEKALFNEFGTANMPAQPFIRPAFEAQQRRVSGALEDAAHQVVDAARVTGTHEAAEILKEEIQRRAPVDTGELRRSVKIVEGKS